MFVTINEPKPYTGIMPGSKKIRLLFFMALIIAHHCHTLHAQESNIRSVDYQFDVSLTGTTRPSLDSLDYLRFGGSAAFVFFPMDKFTLKWGLGYYESKLYYPHLHGKESGYYTSVEYTIQSLSMPLYLRISSQGNFRVFLESGVELNWYKTVKEKGFYTYITDTLSNHRYVYSGYQLNGSPQEVKKTDFHLTGGIGMIIPVKKIGIVVGVHYLYAPLYFRNDVMEPVQNSYWTVSLGIITRRVKQPRF